MGRPGQAAQQHHGADDLAGLAVAALGHGLVQPGLLHRVQRAASGQAFDGGDRLAGQVSRCQQAPALRLAVHQHRAGTALALAAAELGADQAEVFAQQVEQPFLLPVRRDGVGLAIDQQGQGGHGRWWQWRCRAVCVADRPPS
jgi:hypothetical protein